MSTLAAHAPQQVSGWRNNQAAIFGFSGAYVYDPVLMASSELDEALAFGATNPGCACAKGSLSLAYTSRRATDAPGIMGQDNATISFAIQGATPTAQVEWDGFSAGSLSTYQPYQQDGVRGYIWFVGEYGGTAVGWSTRIFSLRTQ